MEGGPDKPELVAAIEIHGYQADNGDYQKYGQDFQQGQEGFFKFVHRVAPFWACAFRQCAVFPLLSGR